MRTSLVLAAAACLLQTAAAFVGTTPMLRPSASVVSRSSPLTIVMGRKPATVGKNAPTREKKQRERTSKGVGAVIKVRKVAGVDMCKKTLVKKIEGATKDNFEAEIIANDKVKTFITEEAGSSMYPKLMKKIRFTAQRLGVSIPDRWSYVAKGNEYQRTQLAAKAKAAAEAAAEAEGAEEAAPAEA